MTTDVHQPAEGAHRSCGAAAHTPCCFRRGELLGPSCSNDDLVDGLHETEAVSKQAWQALSGRQKCQDDRLRSPTEMVLQASVTSKRRTMKIILTKKPTKPRTAKPSAVCAHILANSANRWVLQLESDRLMIRHGLMPMERMRWADGPSWNRATGVKGRHLSGPASCSA
jgi:hypothetical protein